MAKFEHISADTLISYLKGRKYKYAQVHHTFRPNHADFNGNNHISLQQGMYNYHVNTNGWSDIGQHVTLFPDGTFVTGRPFSKSPAGIKGYNTGSFMIEMIGDFDKGKDKLEGEQLKSALKVYQYLTTENGAEILFHREKASKSCPGTGIDKSKFVKAVKNFDGKTVDVSASGGSSKPKPKPSKPSSGGSSYTTVAGSWTGQTLKQGQKGGAVRELQTMLAKNNPPFYPNKGAENNGIDGFYGPDTADAVNRFQGYYGLSVDSMAGKEVYGQLGGKPKSSGGGGGKKMASAYKGKRVESKTNGLRFYSKASWSDSNVVGHVDKGVGFPTIVSRHKVGNGYQYKVKNSKGNVYYITASSKYVDVKGKGKKTSKKKKSSSYKVGSKVTIKDNARVYATGERIPKSVKGNTYTIMQSGKGKVLLREIMSWVKKKDVS